MSRLVSIAPELGKVKTYLNQIGYEVLDMEECIRPVEAIIYSGEVSQTPPATDPKAKNTILVNASGLAPEEVGIELENRLG